MKKHVKRKIFLSLIGISFYLILWIPNAVFNTYSILINSGLLFLIIGLVFIFDEPLDRRISLVFLLFLDIIFASQTIYHRAFDQYGSIATLFSLKSELVQVSSSIFDILKISDLKFIFLAILIIMLPKMVNFSKSRNKHSKKVGILFLTLSIVFTLFYFYTINKNRNTEDDFLYYKTDHYIYITVPNTNLFVSKFSLLGWTLRDIERSMIEPLFSNNNQENQDISNLLSKNQEVPPIGEFHGIFEGKSLLLIEAESLNNLTIDPDLTPNLYRMYQNGYKFTNYNSPLLFGSTSDAELMANTGLVPSNDGYITFHKYVNNTYPITLANSFNELGYKSLAVHNNYGEFYNRETVMPTFGYEFLDCVGMGFQTQFVLDSLMAEKLSWIMVEKEKFFGFWITFNAHQPYDTSSMESGYKPYLTLVEQKFPDLPSEEQVYLAKNMDFDLALGKLIEVYEMMGKLDDLVIIIYGDHHPKGIFENPDDFEELCSTKNLELSQCLSTPLLIWNNDQFVGTSDKVSSPIDISPTIYDLFNIDYNPQQMLGHSIFDPMYNGFYFDASGTISTNDFTYNVNSKELVVRSNITYDDALREAETLIKELNLGHKIIENNYFETLNPQ